MANLDRLRQLTLSAIQPATQALVGGGSPAAWATAMKTAITRAQTAAYIAGAAERLKVRPDSPLLSQARLSRAERQEIQKAVNAQMKYLEGFKADLGRMTEAQIQARAALYAGAAQAMYGRARYPGLPFYPGDGGTPCLGNCRCSWEEATEGFYWRLGAAEHCTGCVDRAGRSPYRVGA